MAAVEATTGAQRPGVEALAGLVAWVFVLVGIAGFVPGLTEHTGNLDFLGHGSGAQLLGLFQVSVLHNVVHLLFGFAGLALCRTHAGARTYLVGGGLVYLAIWLYGVIVSHGGPWNFVPVNRADDFLHLGLGLGMVALGVATGRDGRAAT